jgi:hypothetical protein
MRNPEAGLDEFHGAENLLASQSNHFLVIGRELAAVTDRKLPFGLCTGLDHLFAFFDGDLHGFLAEDMFAGFRGPNCIFCVHPVWQHHVDNVNLRVVGDTVERLIIVNIFAREVVLVRPNLFLGGGAGDNGCQTQFFVFCNAGAIWLVLSEPRPTRANPSFFLPAHGAVIEAAIGAAIAAAPARSERSMN